MSFELENQPPEHEKPAEVIKIGKDDDINAVDYSPPGRIDGGPMIIVGLIDLEAVVEELNSPRDTDD